MESYLIDLLACPICHGDLKWEIAGGQGEFVNRCAGRALPTPISDILEGTRIDGLPVAETVLEWGVLVGRK